ELARLVGRAVREVDLLERLQRSTTALIGGGGGGDEGGGAAGARAPRGREGAPRQPMRFIRGDFPEPEGPMIATYSPRWSVSEAPRRAWTSSEPMRYVFQTSSIWMSGSAGLSAALIGWRPLLDSPPCGATSAGTGA